MRNESVYFQHAASKAYVYAYYTRWKTNYRVVAAEGVGYIKIQDLVFVIIRLAR